MRTRRTLPLVVTLAALAASPARAENELAVRAGTTFAIVADEGLFATGGAPGITQAELSYARTVARLGPGALWIEGGWSIGSRGERSLYGRFDASLLAQQLTVGARWSWPVLRWLAPHVRVGLGGLAGELQLQEGGSRSDTWSGAFTSYALAGVTLTIPRRPRDDGRTPPTVGVVVEGGGVFSSPLAFHAEPSRSGDLLTIPTGGVDLGALTLTGPVVRLGAVVRF